MLNIVAEFPCLLGLTVFQTLLLDQEIKYKRLN